MSAAEPPKPQRGANELSAAAGTAAAHAVRRGKLLAARRAAKRRNVGFRRGVRDVHRRHLPGVVLRTRRVPASRGTEHAAGLRAARCANEGVHDRARRSAARGDSPRGKRRSSSLAAPLSFRLLHRGVAVLSSITDEHIGGTVAPSGVRAAAQRRPVDSLACARVRRARVRPRREVRPAEQARTADPLAGRRCAGRQHRALVQEHAVRLESGHRQGRVGRLRQYAVARHPRRRAPRLVASLVRDPGRRRRARSLRVRRGRPVRNPRSLHAAHRPPRIGAALESRTVGVARALQNARGSGGDRGQASRAQDPVRRADP